MQFLSAKRQKYLLGLCAALSCALSGGVSAQSDFPTKPLRMIIANTPGSTVDLIGRHIGDRIGAILGQPIVVINQPGAGGLVGAQTLARSQKDGYTLGFYGNTAVIVPHLHKALNYDPLRDIATLAIVGNIPFAAVVPRQSPFNSLAELVAAARAKPGALKVGSAGNGTAIHLAAMQWQALAGIDLLHVAYKGVAPMQTALVGGEEIDLAFPTVGSVAALVKDGRLRALATTGSQRSPVMAQVPTVAEAGHPGFVFESWLALVSPSGLPESVAARLSEAARSAVVSESTQKLFSDNSITSAIELGASAQAIVDRDFHTMGELVRRAGLTAQ